LFSSSQCRGEKSCRDIERNGKGLVGCWEWSGCCNKGVVLGFSLSEYIVWSPRVRNFRAREKTKVLPDSAVHSALLSPGEAGLLGKFLSEGMGLASALEDAQALWGSLVLSTGRWLSWVDVGRGKAPYRRRGAESRGGTRSCGPCSVRSPPAGTPGRRRLTALAVLCHHPKDCRCLPLLQHPLLWGSVTRLRGSLQQKPCHDGCSQRLSRVAEPGFG